MVSDSEAARGLRIDPYADDVLVLSRILISLIRNIQPIEIIEPGTSQLILNFYGLSWSFLAVACR